MHFHMTAQCLNCRVRRVLSTPIPDVVILVSTCESCGWNDLVGLDADERLCAECMQHYGEDVLREMSRVRPEG